MSISKVYHAPNHVPTLPLFYGATPAPKGVYFKIFSRNASRVWLLLFKTASDEAPYKEYELTPEKHRVGDVWNIYVPRIKAGSFYVYRMESEADGPDGKFFDPDQWLLDPYAKAISGSARWGDTNGFIPGQQTKNGKSFPKCIVVDDHFEWGNDVFPNTPMDESIIYEMHTRGFTAHVSSGVKRPGTYAGLMSKLPYLKKLGITAIELLPMQEFNEMEYFIENGNRINLRNYWGYSTQGFFAPMGRYSVDGTRGDQVKEFKKLVKACHRAGIEVILDVVFNHTDEGNGGGPTWCFRGIDNAVYYIMDQRQRDHYQNYSGCGNTLNCNNVVVREFILDCLKYWHHVMHVDGFRFDLASILTRGTNGAPLSNPPLVEAITEDPALKSAKVIAEAWDAAGLYQVGSFPGKRWAEWNGKYRDDVRRFWKGDQGMLRSFVRRLIGSPDLYAKDGQTPQKSINFITCHDGFTMNDLVSYNGKHNEANCENNNDGENHNNSCNYGEEGPSLDPGINALRLKQSKNLLATLFLSQGVPMMLAGDEFMRTQQGSNNAYCQDNDISWIDWKMLSKHRELHRFVTKLIAFRKAHACLRKKAFLNDKWDADPDVRWYGPEGNFVEWDHGQCIACQLVATDKEDEDLFIVYNASTESRTFALPKTTYPWQLCISTQIHQPKWKFSSKSLKVEAQSINVLRSSLL